MGMVAGLNHPGIDLVEHMRKASHRKSPDALKTALERDIFSLKSRLSEIPAHRRPVGMIIELHTLEVAHAYADASNDLGDPGNLQRLKNAKSGLDAHGNPLPSKIFREQGNFL